MEIQGLECVAPPMRDPLRRYAGRVAELGGKNLVSLVAYGAIASPTFEMSRQLASSVIVLKSADLPMLRQLGAEGTSFGKWRISAPVVMTPQLIAASLDSFPLELIEIHQRHCVLLGTDPFVGLQFKEEHIRLECERELKTIAIGMTQGVVSSAGGRHALFEIGLKAMEELMRTLRGLVWLKGQQQAQPAAQVVTEMETILGRPLPAVRRGLSWSKNCTWEEFQALYDEVEALGHSIDAW